VRTGRLLVGPWYVLADELLSSDEALVRNLLMGRRQANALGGGVAVGYSPDAFGHPAALPGILRGFGIEHAIVWRGYGGRAGQQGDVFVWSGPDGATVLTHHLAPSGYEFGSALPTDSGQLRVKWIALEKVLAARAMAPVWLLPVGADHHEPQSDLPDILSRLREIAPQHQFVMASPDDYFRALPSTSGAPQVRGELRFSYGYTWTLQGVHATRSAMKRGMMEAERLLLRWAEPMAALARVESTARVDRTPLLQAAWSQHLLSYAHDSFGGCCADAVAREVVERSARAAVEARGIMVDAALDSTPAHVLDPLCWKRP
jgi:mannosylglycerate hydrolase